MPEPGKSADDGAAREERYSWLPRISVGRPVTVLMLVCALVLLGVVALLKMPIQLMPSGFDPPFMVVRVPYPGANPSEVEEKIIHPLEEAFYTVRGIQEVNCRASGDSGRCWAEFSQSVDMEEAYNQVADRVERLQATVWPEDVERVRIRRFNPTSDAPLKVGITLPRTIEDPYWVLQNRVVNRVERVTGVAQVDLEGVQEKQIFIEPDRDALEAHRVSLWQLVQSLRRANFAIASGDVRDGSRKLLVRSVARFLSLKQIEDLPIREDGLRLGEVARVRYDFPELERVSRLDGQPAAVLEVFKESEANTIEVTSAAREELERIYEDEPLFASTDGFRVLFDQGEVIRESIDQLRDTGLIGALFAVLILYFFLRRFRVTLLITMAIPASLLAALVVMYFAGDSINQVSLMGLIICTGMLVDNAVVVVENIDRYRRTGSPGNEAALAGASEIGLALTMATVTTIAVFVPMVIMSGEGMMRFFLTRLSVPVIFSILASLVVALLFVPLAASVLLRAESRRTGPRRGVPALADALYGKVMKPLHRLYLASLRLTLRHRANALAVVAATLFVTFVWPGPARDVEFAIMGRGHHGGRQVRFWFNLPNNYGMEEADDWFRRVEAIVAGHRDEFAVEHIQTRFWHNRGMVRVILKGSRETDVSVDEVAAGIRALLPDAPGIRTYVNWQRGSGEEPSLTISLYGEDTETLAQISDEVERRLRQLPGLVSVEPDLENALEEVRIRVSREQALRYAVSPEVISGTVTSALRGQALPRYRQGEKEIEIRVQFPEEDREGIGRLASLDLRSSAGGRIPLEALANISIARGYGDIERRDRRTTLGIKLNTSWDNLEELRSEVTRVMDGVQLPRGYSWDFGSEMRWQRRENSNLLFGLLLAMIFVYLIMGFLFESVLLPLSVMPSIVLSWLGVAWLLWATNAKLDMMAAIGLVLLAGVVVNNGIILVDLVNRLRRSGMDRSEAILEAGRLRFRPILMTALTTIMGMLPMAIGRASFVGMPYASLGKTFIGGLASSTTLTLVVVPLFYTLLDDAGELLTRLAFGRRRAPVSET